MKLADLRKEKSFFKDCFLNDLKLHEIIELEKMYKKAKSLDELKNIVILSEEERVKKSQCYAVASKELPGHWKRIRSMIGNKCKKTISDVGGLKIGNSEFSIIIPNGLGDGTTRYAIYEAYEGFNEQMLAFSTSVQGEIDIYNYDCGDEIVDHISGRYGIYSGNGFIIFQKWN